MSGEELPIRYAVRVVVVGLVQGVFYRQSCLHRAEALGVTGWVRNNSDGTVEGVFAGDRGAVETLVAWCHRGSRSASVQSVRVTPARDPGTAWFEVR